MEILVLVPSLKSIILSSTSLWMDITFWGVVRAAVEQSRLKANVVAQGDGKLGPRGWPKNPSKPKTQIYATPLVSHRESEHPRVDVVGVVAAHVIVWGLDIPKPLFGQNVQVGTPIYVHELGSEPEGVDWLRLNPFVHHRVAGDGGGATSRGLS